MAAHAHYITPHYFFRRHFSMASNEIPVLPGPAASSSSSSTPTRSKKRVRRPDSWARNVARRKRAKGEEYVSPRTGATVGAVKQGPPCTCRSKCFTKFTDEELKKIFDCFWGLGEKNIQDAYLHGLIRVRKVARRRARSSLSQARPRLASYVYVVG